MNNRVTFEQDSSSEDQSTSEISGPSDGCGIQVKNLIPKPLKRRSLSPPPSMHAHAYDDDDTGGESELEAADYGAAGVGAAGVGAADSNEDTLGGGGSGSDEVISVGGGGGPSEDTASGGPSEDTASGGPSEDTAGGGPNEDTPGGGGSDDVSSVGASGNDTELADNTNHAAAERVRELCIF